MTLTTKSVLIFLAFKAPRCLMKMNSYLLPGGITTCIGFPSRPDTSQVVPIIWSNIDIFRSHPTNFSPLISYSLNGRGSFLTLIFKIRFPGYQEYYTL